MSAKTKNWQIPYPTINDKVDNTPQALQAMAERIDQILTKINQGRNTTNGQD